MKETGLLARFNRVYDKFVDWCVAKEAPISQPQYSPKVNSTGITRTVVITINEMFPVEKFPSLNKVLLDEAEYTPLGSIRTLTEAETLGSVRDMPEYLESPSEALTGTRWSRISYTLWVLYDADGTGYVVNPKPTSGNFTCGPDILQYDYPLDEMPWDVCRAIKITVGTRLFNSELRGVSFEHYAR